MTKDRQRPARKPTLKDKQREQTRAKLLQAARDLFRNYGYDDVSVTEIAREAGVTHSMINVYFGGKPGLLYEIVRANNGPQLDRTRRIADSGASVRSRLSDIIRLWMEADGHDPRLLAVLHSFSWQWSPDAEAENLQDLAPFLDSLGMLIREGQSTGDFSADLDPRLSSKAIFAVYTSGMRPLVLQGETMDDAHHEIMLMVDQILRP